MIYLLDSLGIFGIALLFFAVLIGIILFLRFFISKKSKEIQTKTYKLNPLSKKFTEVDVNRYRGIIANIGLALSMALVLSAFEFPDFEKSFVVDICKLKQTEIDTMMTVITKWEEPKPPKVKAPSIEVVEEEVPEEENIDFSMDVLEDDIIEIIEIVDDEPVEEVVIEDVFDIVEESASPVGGFKEFYKFVKKKIKYPNQAKRIGVEGKVYVQFVVDKDGSITEVTAIRGIGAGCDEEAVRILSLAPKWNPGKQRGRPVKQRIVIPINFKLGN
ncbi:energy transducer TonB [Chondrinema litorale]|uniref:energy transducer TonB n=1 Tax=Chondrinema litorale TaxID=2994555 RepID=UPI002543F84A|nr:energy transducer TonB [Chondrinema litorale]UZR92843.1 energy transducer TonB [Chondrinema litorale]